MSRRAAVHARARRAWAAAAMAQTMALLWSASCASPTGTPQGSGGKQSAGTGGGKADAAPPEDGSGGAPSRSGGASGTGSGGRPDPGTGGVSTGSGGMSGASGSPGSGGAQSGTGGATGAEGGGRAGVGGLSGAAGLSGGGGTPGPGAGGRAGGAGSSGSAGTSGCDFSNADGKIVLFDGSLAGWQNTATGGAAQWRLVGDGSMEVVAMNPSTNIQTTMKFDDLCLHIEYMTPMYATSVTGQQRGNSGIYFRRAYEVQVLDSYGQPPLIDGCGAIYGISPPMVVACHMELVWNTYEIEFKASQWDGSRKTKNAMFVLATLNGQVVQRNVDLTVSMTTSGQPDAPGPQPVMLQDHGNAVRYRNIWAKIPH